jgi:type II secretion system protein N
MKKWLLAAVLALLMGPPVLWLFAIPDSLISGVVEREAQKQGLSVKVNGFGKGILLSFKADDVVISQKGTELVKVENLKGRISPFSLFLLKAKIPFKGIISEGVLTGEATLRLSSQDISAKIENVKTAGVPVLSGVAQGDLSADLKIENGKGVMTFILKDISRAPLSIKEANGIFEISGEEINLKSVSMEGENLNAKLKGSIANGFYRLTAEIMPRGSGIPENELLKYSLAQYEVSPGYYVRPLTGELRELP